MEDLKVIGVNTGIDVENHISTSKEEINELLRLVEIANEKKKFYENKIEEYMYNINKIEEKTINFCISIINRDFYKESKTQYSYTVPSGKIVIKKPYKSMKLKEDFDLLKETQIPERFIKSKLSVNWIEFKKILKISDNNNVINTQTGEILDVVEVVDNKSKSYIDFD